MEHMSRWRRNLKESANKVRDKIWFHYLITKMQLCSLIILELSTSHKKC